MEATVAHKEAEDRKDPGSEQRQHLASASGGGGDASASASAADGARSSDAAAAAPAPSTSMPPPPTRAPWAAAAQGAAGPVPTARPPSGGGNGALGGVGGVGSGGGGGVGSSIGGVRSVSPAAGSHFPQLARPLPGGAAVTGSTHDTMSPTAAPWAVGAPPQPPPPQHHGHQQQQQQQQMPGPAGPATGFPAPTGPRSLSPSVAALRRPLGGPAGLVTGRPVAPLVEAAPAMPSPAGASTGEATPAAAAGGGTPRAFEAPTKRIASDDDLRRFLEGPTARDFVAFILSLNQAVTGVKLSAPCTVAPPLAALAAALDELRAWVDEVPPAAQPLRYGNPAFREWHARVAAAAPGIAARCLPPELRAAGAEAELAPYLADSFGNATRIDYGTGHETAFVAFLYCLAALGVVGEGDRVALVNVVFEK